MIAISPELNSSSLFHSFNFFKTVFPPKPIEREKTSDYTQIKIFLTPQKATPIVLLLIDLVKTVNNELIMLSPKEAKAILQELSSFTELYDAFFDSLDHIQTKNLDEYTMINTLIELVRHIEIMHNELDLIANREDIDENSNEYQQFLSELTSIGLKSDRSKIGNSLREII